MNKQILEIQINSDLAMMKKATKEDYYLGKESEFWADIKKIGEKIRNWTGIKNHYKPNKNYEDFNETE